MHANQLNCRHKPSCQNLRAGDGLQSRHTSHAGADMHCCWRRPCAAVPQVLETTSGARRCGRHINSSHAAATPNVIAKRTTSSAQQLQDATLSAELFERQWRWACRPWHNLTDGISHNIMNTGPKKHGREIRLFEHHASRCALRAETLKLLIT